MGDMTVRHNFQHWHIDAHFSEQSLPDSDSNKVLDAQAGHGHDAVQLLGIDLEQVTQG